MALLFAGYFPKRIALRADWLKAPLVKEIWSVSDCISEGPPDWIDKWLHNDLGLFDTPELAESVVPEPDRGQYTIVGYRVWDRMFDHGKDVPLSTTPSSVPGPAPGFISLGFDAVARSMSSSFECSPLSCNGGAATFLTNENCLFETLDAAIAGAREFSSGNWEPGPYWVVEVLSRGPADRR
jgi:hypothetical protein